MPVPTVRDKYSPNGDRSWISGGRGPRDVMHAEPARLTGRKGDVRCGAFWSGSSMGRIRARHAGERAGDVAGRAEVFLDELPAEKMNKKTSAKQAAGLTGLV